MAQPWFHFVVTDLATIRSMGSFGFPLDVAKLAPFAPRQVQEPHKQMFLKAWRNYVAPRQNRETNRGQLVGASKKKSWEPLKLFVLLVCF